MPDSVHWFFTTGLCGLGFGVSVWYVWASSPTAEPDGEAPPAAQERPWRRRGAIVCAVTSVLFYVGMHFVDPSRWPKTFLGIWIVVLLLAFWLCLLAVADMLHTRRLTRQELQRNRRP